MGTKRIETTWDLVRFGANLRVTCHRGHVATTDGGQIDRMRAKRNWPLPLGYLSDKLLCSKCGRRPLAVDFTANDPTIRIGPSLGEELAARREQDKP